MLQILPPCRVGKMLLGILLVIAAKTHAQKISFEHLSAEDGLSQNSVLAITQDRQGFLWLGTRSGLNRYDGRRFRTYRAGISEQGGLGSSYILSLLTDGEGRLWAGTRNGLGLYQPDQDRFEQIGFKVPPGKEVYINHLFEDSRKRLWAAANGGVYVVDNLQNPVLSDFTYLADQQLRMVYVVFEDRKKNIWIGAQNGLFRFTPRGESFDMKRFRTDPENKNGLADDNFTSVTEDKNGNIWVGTLNGGLYRYDPAKEFFTAYRHSGANSLLSDHVRKILPDLNSNRLWIGTQEGVSLFDIEVHTFRNYANEPGNNESLSQNSVHSLFFDDAGTIWIGTFFGGVNSYSPYFNHFSIYNNNSDSFRLNNNVISSVIEDQKGNLWIGTEGGGLNYCERRSGEVRFFLNDPARSNSIGSNLVKVIYRDREDDIWVGTHGGGLNRIRHRENEISFLRYPYNPVQGDAAGLEITSILEDSAGLLWVGTEKKGLTAFIRDGDRLHIDSSYRHLLASLGKASIGSLIETEPGKLWIGTTEGIYILNGKSLKKLNETATLSINCLFNDGRGKIWVGTANNGLMVFDYDGTRTALYTTKDGLPHDNILGILQDDKKNLWVSTGDGLARVSPDGSFKIFNRHDGLSGNTFNNNSYYRAADGKMFFGGYDGLISFYPEEIRENQRPAPVYITGMSFPDQEKRDEVNYDQTDFAGNHISLKYDQNIFTVDFAVLNFIKPGKNNYAYRLDGYDETWRFTNQPSASFTNVPPGEYTFWCKGSNNDDVWSEPVFLTIKINPPFWKTWWAYTIYALLLASLVFFIAYFFYLRALYRRNNELTQIKLNFFTNISHEIRTHLSLIIAPSEKLIRSSKRNEVNIQDVQMIKSNSESLLQLVNELMDFRKAETGHLPLHVTANDLNSFIDQVHTAFAEMFSTKNISTGLNGLPGEVGLWFDKEQMEKVMYNLLYNAYKFTPDGGFVEMNVREMPESVVIEVINNGRGIAKDNLDKLFDNYFQENDYGQQNTGYGIGLALSKSIVELHKGQIRVRSEKRGADDHLTCFSVELSKGKEHFTEEQITAISGQLTISRPRSAFTADPAEYSDAAEPKLSGQRNEKKTVLVVEDNKDLRRFIREILQQEYNILESENGQHGWEQATTHMPDLIISDVMMPVMDGLVFCDKLKTDIRTSHIPVVLLTAKTSVESQVSGLQVGADVYLSKPFSIEVLELQVNNLLAAKERMQRQLSELLAGSGKPKGAGEYGGREGIQPQQQSQALHPLDESFLNELIKLVEDNTDNLEFGVAMLSKLVGMSHPVLLKKIRAITGMSANDFIKSLRLKKACGLLLENRYTVYEIAYMVGYEDSKYFSREFKKEFGKTPTEYAANG